MIILSLYLVHKSKRKDPEKETECLNVIAEFGFQKNNVH